MASFESHIEYTLLRQNARWEEAKSLIDMAAEKQYLGVCLAPYFVKQAARHIKEQGYKQKLITVIGFPMGYSSVSAKVEEVKKAIMEGAEELDVVINLSAFFSKDMAVLKNDIQSVITACHLQNKLIKVILETGALNEKEMLKLADICVASDANFIKTSTGYFEIGAEMDKVKKLKEYLPAKVKIKASGGIRTRERAEEFIAAGASRIGASTAL
ncbi:MAG TPA: deoxyribose-phosphate aldolase [Bacteroidetes bacterium]|nr:deoxyribose-phosphate aldolase [Bacteroidota bacterium]